jgi:sulfur relay protein TusB/DsrH
MSPLHTIHNAAALGAALARSGQDPILLVEDGVYAAHQPPVGRRVYVLREDLAGRGLAEETLADPVVVVDMREFVALAAAHSPIVAWL